MIRMEYLVSFEFDLGWGKRLGFVSDRRPGIGTETEAIRLAELSRRNAE